MKRNGWDADVDYSNGEDKEYENVQKELLEWNLPDLANTIDSLKQNDMIRSKRIVKIFTCVSIFQKYFIYTFIERTNCALNPMKLASVISKNNFIPLKNDTFKYS